MIKRILQNIVDSSKILECSPVTLYRLGTCLFMLNRIESVNPNKYDKFARAAFASVMCDVGNHAAITANTHAALCHGASFIKYAQEEVGESLGKLTEGSLESGNKLNLNNRKRNSYKGNLKKELYQIFERRLMLSSPFLILEGVQKQELRPGRVLCYRRALAATNTFTNNCKKFLKEKYDLNNNTSDPDFYLSSESSEDEQGLEFDSDADIDD